MAPAVAVKVAHQLEQMDAAIAASFFDLLHWRKGAAFIIALWKPAG